MLTVKEYLSPNSYPGRGVLLGITPDGTRAVCAYFIMGRSDNSRNRVFVSDGDGIRTKAADPARMSDPSLVIYAPVRVYENNTIVTNGDQTDTIYDSLSASHTFADALRTRTFEPDPPHFTPRISGLLTLDNGSASIKLSVLRSMDGAGAPAVRCFWEYQEPLAGEGRIIHTYMGNGNPLPSFEGDPVRVAIPDDIKAFTAELWESLSAENRISLLVREIRIADGKFEDTIINRYREV